MMIEPFPSALVRNDEPYESTEADFRCHNVKR